MKFDAILQRMGFSSLNPMQEKILEEYQDKRDLILLSPTGSGKTLAFSLIVLSLLKDTPRSIQVLVVVPTRELAMQIEQVLRKVAQGFKISCVYGGHDTRTEKNTLKDAPSVLIGTPGRLKYHLEAAAIDPSSIHALVLDEFDKSLELGFQEQMEFIINQIPNVQSKILTSATKMDHIPSFTKVVNPILVDFLKDNDHSPKLITRKVIAPSEKKLEALLKLICKIGQKKVLIFCNHREAVDHVSELLENRRIIHDTFHGGLEQQDRELALLKFRNNSNQILITTDLAARGLDIPDVDAIIHYQLPYKEDAFIHRNGRTARMQASGKVFVILKPEEDYPYIAPDTEEEDLTEFHAIPENTPFTTLYVNAGRKDKVNKVDLVGFLLNIPDIAKDDIGLIEVKDKEIFVAVNRRVAIQIIKHANGQKIKGRKIKIGRT